MENDARIYWARLGQLDLHVRYMNHIGQNATDTEHLSVNKALVVQM